MNVENKNLGSEAEDANDRASELLTATQNMQDKEFNKLSQDMEVFIGLVCFSEI